LNKMNKIFDDTAHSIAHDAYKINEANKPFALRALQ